MQEPSQREYDPFTRRRALSEEVGDLVAEGLFALLRRSGAVDPLRFSTPYWEQVVQYRRSMIDDVVRLVKGERDGLEKTREGRRLQDALVALKAASGVYRIACGGKSTNIAAHAVSYVRALEADVASWARVMRTASWDDVTAPIRDPMCATVYGVPNADAWLAGGPVKGGAAAIDKDREAQLAGTARD